MIKMVAFAVEKEELPIFQNCKDRYEIDLTCFEEKPNLERIKSLKAFDVINVLSDTVITEQMWNVLKEKGVKIGITRCIGMEHMNKEYAESLGITVMNISYSPSSVADYAIMMMLMVLRHVKPIMQRYTAQDFTPKGFRGRELPSMTVGIIGAGNIGSTVIKHLSGFGCPIYYWNRSEKKELEPFATFCSLDTLLTKSDIVSIHIAYSDETYHFMDKEKIAKMKEGSVLINTARGPIVDTSALIEALEKGKLGGAGLDVFEGDRTIYYRNFKNQLINNHELAILNAMQNVLMLPHFAYFTDQALYDMVSNSIKKVYEALQ
ncbi:MAG: hypothetical protein K6E51_09805 [Treponema sp.]|nr:hypothetical protein [Treponema sp.]